MSETEDVVVIALFERVIGGVYPDGSLASEKLMAVVSFVEVELNQPLGPRTVVDESTGQALPPTPVNASVPERQRYGTRGCPRWRRP